MMMQALVDSSHGCRRGVVLQFVKMLAVIALPQLQQPASTCSYLCVTCRQLVIALPMAAVVGLVSYTLHSSRVERASQLSAVEQFRVFEDVEHLETSIRAERGYTTSAVLLRSAVLLLRSAVLLTSVVLLDGEDEHANEHMVKQRSRTDEILHVELTVWPEGLVVDEEKNGQQLAQD